MTMTTQKEKPVFTMYSPTGLCMKALDLLHIKATPRHLEGSVPLTHTIASVELTPEILNMLRENGFEVGRMKSPANDDVFGILDVATNGRDGLPEGHVATTHWLFPLQMENGEPKKIHFRALVHLNRMSRGIGLRAQAECNGIVAPGHNNSHFRMLKLLMPYIEKKIEGYPALAIMAESEDGTMVVNWGDLGLGGLRDIASLFNEWRGRNEQLEHLANSSVNPFDPAPFSHGSFSELMFIPEPEHKELFRTWSSQRKEFTSEL